MENCSQNLQLNNRMLNCHLNSGETKNNIVHLVGKHNVARVSSFKSVAGNVVEFPNTMLCKFQCLFCRVLLTASFCMDAFSDPCEEFLTNFFLKA